MKSAKVRESATHGATQRRRRSHARRRPEPEVKTSISSWSAADFALSLYRASGPELVKLVKIGLPARAVGAVTERMTMPKAKFYATIGLVRATVDRKVREDKLLSQDESERLVGIARLVGQVQSILQESGSSPEFDSAKWVAGWLDRPLPALGGKRPAEFMDTAIGRSLVADVLTQQQSGAFG